MTGAVAPDPAVPATGRLAHNITHFARALRAAGMPVGPGRVVDAVRAVAATGFGAREDFYWALHGCFVGRAEHRVVFEQVFRLFWRDPRYLDQMMSLLIPSLRGGETERLAAPGEKRAAQALLDGVRRDPPPATDADSGIEVDAAGTVSAQERIRTLDFEQMDVTEIAAARAMLARLTLPVPPALSRRSRAEARGRIVDWRRTMQAAVRQGGEVTSVAMRARSLRAPNLIVLCDISGSMAQYSRMVLHFVHAVANHRLRHGEAGWGRVHAFTFATRLTNITRHLGARDVDAALAGAGAQAQDWEGGTRIAASLHAFNRDWSRRVTGPGAVVVLITDGLDCDDAGPQALAQEMARLHLSARRLIWVNPLLRWDGFVPRAAGIRAMLPHVDCFRAGHSVAALAGLAAAISQRHAGDEKARLMAAMAR